MYEVTQPLVSIGIRITGPYWHIESALTNKGAGVGRHVGQVIHHHKHLHHSAVRVEESHLDSAFVGNMVALLSQVYMALKQYHEWDCNKT